MAQMTAQASLPVPANGKALLEPGGLHLMLMQPLRLLRAGDKVVLNIMFDDGAPVVLTVPVIKQDTQGK